MLSAQRVEEIFLDCLFNDDEDTADHVECEGILHTAWFHPGRLETNRTEIGALLDELPEPFHEAGGGGWSFLNACNDKNNVQWTGFHQTMERLFLLGIGIGRAQWLLPRNMWSAFPGGMPYVVVKTETAVDAQPAE